MTVISNSFNFDEMGIKFVKGCLKKWTRYFNACSVMELDDVVQEVLLKVFEDGHKFDAQKGSFENWVYMISNHCACDCKKECEKEIEKLKLIETENKVWEIINSTLNYTEDCAIANDRYTKLLSLIQKLPEHQKHAFWMCAVNQIPYREVAQTMNVSEASVTNWVHRARIKLQNEVLKDRLYDYAPMAA